MPTPRGPLAYRRHGCRTAAEAGVAQVKRRYGRYGSLRGLVPCQLRPPPLLLRAFVSGMATGPRACALTRSALGLHAQGLRVECKRCLRWVDACMPSMLPRQACAPHHETYDHKTYEPLACGKRGAKRHTSECIGDSWSASTSSTSIVSIDVTEDAVGVVTEPSLCMRMHRLA